MSHTPADALLDDWRLLRRYAWYRFFVPLVLLGLFLFNPSTPVVGAHNRALFIAITLIYALTALSNALLLQKPRTGIRHYTLIVLLLDSCVLGLLMLASGGMNMLISGLLIVLVAAGNFLLQGRWGALIAAFATLTVFYTQLYGASTKASDVLHEELIQSSGLGIGFFITALLTQLMAIRWREDRTLTEQRHRDLESLQQMNALIVQRLRTGLIAVNEKREVLISNNAAAELLGLTQTPPLFSQLTQHTLALAAVLEEWEKHPERDTLVFRHQENSPDIRVSFTPLAGQDPKGHVLIFIEDQQQLAAQAQQLKLASLGRLTASIAHEIRNPLGAISHAAQLLNESTSIAGSDQRLLTIIHQHCQRVSAIIENVQQVSRRTTSVPATMLLDRWLQEFREHYVPAHRVAGELVVDIADHNLRIRFDSSQLDQVLTNLIDNGFRHASTQQTKPKVLIRAGLSKNGLVTLTVHDNGPGISPAHQAHLFEPFFTTENTGSGLGLYLAREMCEANQARLDFIADLRHADMTGACFQLRFSDAQSLS